MNNFNKTDEQLAKDMEAKFILMMNLIEEKADPNTGIFANEVEFLKVKRLDNAITKLWNHIKDESCKSEEIYYATITHVADIIEINKKHYAKSRQQ